MIGYPPKPTPVMIPKEGFRPQEWLVQNKYRGWRIVIHGMHAYTRKGNELFLVDSAKKKYDYQLDGEIINPKRMTEHGVRTAIKNETYVIKIFDIYVPCYDKMDLMERMKFLENEFGIKVFWTAVKSYGHLTDLLNNASKRGHEGIVLKRRNSPYKISKYCEIIDNNWIKIK